MDKYKIHFFFTTNDWIGQPYNKELQKHIDGKWYSLNSLPDILCPLATLVAQSLNNQKHYEEYGWS